MISRVNFDPMNTKISDRCRPFGKEGLIPVLWCFLGGGETWPGGFRPFLFFPVHSGGDQLGRVEDTETLNPGIEVGPELEEASGTIRGDQSIPEPVDLFPLLFPQSRGDLGVSE